MNMWDVLDFVLGHRCTAMALIVCRLLAVGFSDDEDTWTVPMCSSIQTNCFNRLGFGFHFLRQFYALDFNSMLDERERKAVKIEIKYNYKG